MGDGHPPQGSGDGGEGDIGLIGGREVNPLPPLARWKLLDNLRRSLSPVFTLLTLVLGMCFSGRVFAWAGGIAVLAAASNLLLSGAAPPPKTKLFCSKTGRSPSPSPSAQR
mgnify:CR=1 FL=1